jgi:hypothetical protein
VDWQNLDWADTFSRLVLLAFRRRQFRGLPGSLAEAEDLAAEAIRRLFDSNYKPWDPVREPDLLRHLGSTVNGLLSNDMRAARVKRKRSLSLPLVLQSAEQTATLDADPDAADSYRHAMSLLEARLAKDEIASQLLWLEEEGVTKAALQAAQLKMDVAAIYSARRRLARHCQAVGRELKGKSSVERTGTRSSQLDPP